MCYDYLLAITIHGVQMVPDSYRKNLRKPLKGEMPLKERPKEDFGRRNHNSQNIDFGCM